MKCRAGQHRAANSSGLCLITTKLLAKEWRESAESLGLHIGEQQMQHLLRGGSLARLTAASLHRRDLKLYANQDTRRTAESRSSGGSELNQWRKAAWRSAITWSPAILEQLGASDP